MLAMRARNPQAPDASAWERSRKFSQNFLVRKEAVDRLIRAANLDANDLVVEIGPGRGIVTRELVKRARKVIAIEIDETLCEKLAAAYADNPKIEIRCEDFLKAELPAAEDYKVVSSPPFSISSDIVRKLAFAKRPPTHSVLVLQREAAEMFTGGTRTKALSVLIYPLFHTAIIGTFRATDFSPVPNAQIVLFEMRKRTRPLVSPERWLLYACLVTEAFYAWKRNVKEALASVLSRRQLLALTREMPAIASKKPSELSHAEWVRLANLTIPHLSQQQQELLLRRNRRRVDQLRAVAHPARPRKRVSGTMLPRQPARPISAAGRSRKRLRR